MMDKAIVACVLILAAGYAWMTEQVTTLPFGGDPLGPKAFPRILTIALLCTVVLLVFEGRASKRQPAGDASGDEAIKDAPDGKWVILGTIAVTALYFLLFEPLGFVISSTVYLYVMTSYFNAGKWLPNALVSLLVPIVSYLIFNHVLGAQLARGIFPI